MGNVWAVLRNGTLHSSTLHLALAKMKPQYHFHKHLVYTDENSDSFPIVVPAIWLLNEKQALLGVSFEQ